MIVTLVFLAALYISLVLIDRLLLGFLFKNNEKIKVTVNFKQRNIIILLAAILWSIVFYLLK